MNENDDQRHERILEAVEQRLRELAESREALRKIIEVPLPVEPS